MKLVMVTSVEAFQKDVLKLFNSANIESFSSSEIDGYKNSGNSLTVSNWFSSVKGSNESSMFFSFTEDHKINKLFDLIEEFNSHLETNNPLKAVVIPIEKYI